MKRFREFYTNNKDSFFGYLLRRTRDKNLAADTLQESFTKYLEQYGKCDLKVSLLFTIGRNLINDHFRGSRTTIPYEDDRQPGGSDEEASYLVREKSNMVLAAIQTLTPKEKTVLSLAVGQNLSYREIAERIGTSEANVKVQIHRSRIKIKNILHQENNE